MSFFFSLSFFCLFIAFVSFSFSLYFCFLLACVLLALLSWVFLSLFCFLPLFLLWFPPRFLKSSFPFSRSSLFSCHSSSFSSSLCPSFLAVFSRLFDCLLPLLCFSSSLCFLSRRFLFALSPSVFFCACLFSGPPSFSVVCSLLLSHHCLSLLLPCSSAPPFPVLSLVLFRNCFCGNEEERDKTGILLNHRRLTTKRELKKKDLSSSSGPDLRLLFFLFVAFLSFLSPSLLVVAFFLSVGLCICQEEARDGDSEGRVFASTFSSVSRKGLTESRVVVFFIFVSFCVFVFPLLAPRLLRLFFLIVPCLSVLWLEEEEEEVSFSLSLSLLSTIFSSLPPLSREEESRGVFLFVSRVFLSLCLLLSLSLFPGREETEEKLPPVSVWCMYSGAAFFPKEEKLVLLLVLGCPHRQHCLLLFLPLSVLSRLRNCH